MSNFSRPNGWRFKGGMKTNDTPDALPEDRHVFLQNVRNYDDNDFVSRPPFEQIIAGPISPSPVLSLESSLGVYKIADKLYVNGAVIDSGYSPSLGASIVPFRPNSSPDPWDYVFDDLKSTKVSVPSSGSPIVKKAGTQEPQVPLEAGVGSQFQTFLDTTAAGYIPGGTAAPPTDANRVADTVGAVFLDPASQGGRTIFQVSPSQGYSKFMVLTVAGQQVMVDDVFPNLTTPLQIQGIYYFTGTTGRCVVVPNNLAAEEPSLFTQLLLTSIRRGALVSIGAEICLVLNTSVGPDGSICFETSTINPHTAAESLIVVDAVAVIGSGISSGQAITSPQVTDAISTGIGTLTHVLSGSPFVSGVSSFQPDDYIHISIKHGDLQNINEIKVLFDVGDGTFTGNFYYYTIRPSDLADSVDNVLTQLATSQIAQQREIIDQERVVLSRNQGRTVSSAQTGPGKDQWSEIVFSIRDMTRVGEDQNLSLQNANRIQILYNVSGNIITKINGITVFGGYQADIGFTGNPYQYWAVPRDSTTGAQGNPCPIMRYGVQPRRQLVYVELPAYLASFDPDTWDIYRMGGSITIPRYLSSVSIFTSVYQDNYSDAAIANNRTLARDNYEPFPSIGLPVSITGAAIIGTTMVATIPTSPPNSTFSQLQNLLPGNQLNVGQSVFTLWKRPDQLSSSPNVWLFQLVENAGVLSAPLVQINEPALAAQSNQCVWGPDSNGVFFSVQDPLRPGVVNHTNPNNPDSASDAYTDELCAPSEPLQNGVLLKQTSIVFSPNRAWAGYPSEGGSGYRWVEIPVGAGLAAEFGICTDGGRVYYVAKDGIRATSGGPSESLTEKDLYNLFPHEGVFPAAISTVAGFIFPPDYNFANSFRLAVVNGFLYFDYVATVVILGSPVQVYQTLVCDLRTISWSIDKSEFGGLSIHSATTDPGTTGTTKNQQLFVGDINGAVYIENSSPTPSTGEHVACIVATREFMNDPRSSTMFGDAFLDCLPESGMTVNPVSLGLTISTATTIAASSVRTPSVIDLQGQQIIRSLGLLIQWTDQGQSTSLFSWQPSIIPQPEDIVNRFSDWDDAGVESSKFFQGFEIEFDSFGSTKGFVVRDADSLTTHPFSSSLGTNVVNANGQTIISFSFDNPFIAHSVRIEPQGTEKWRLFRIKWIYQDAPPAVLTWQTQGTAFGMNGYIHCKEVLAAYSSTASVNLAITTFDGYDPLNITLPATGGQYQKVRFSLSPNKGLLYFFRAASVAEWRPYLRDWEIKIKPWGSDSDYVTYKNIGGEHGDQARI